MYQIKVGLHKVYQGFSYFYIYAKFMLASSSERGTLLEAQNKGKKQKEKREKKYLSKMNAIFHVLQMELLYKCFYVL